MSDIKNLCEEISALTKALQAQSKQIQAMAESNANLAAVVAEFMADEIDSDEGGFGGDSTYLDGSPNA